ncbi:MAG: hypothetical protein RQ801_09740, partial [Spirochaetaceae bacterium]|nr:hypothetical protein [Spirochaetaceae bacterium]
AGIPLDPDGSEEKLHLRGGGWLSDLEHAQLSFDRLARVTQWNPIGFRLARNADTSEADPSDRLLVR